MLGVLGMAEVPRDMGTVPTRALPAKLGDCWLGFGFVLKVSICLQLECVHIKRIHIYISYVCIDLET